MLTHPRMLRAWVCVLLHACTRQPLGPNMHTAVPAADSGRSSAGSSGSADSGGRCQLDPTPPSGRLGIEVSGVKREFELVLPHGYDGRTRFAVLFAWHGTGSSGLEFIEPYYGAIVEGGGGRVLIVAPDGLIEDTGEWAGRTRWQLSNVDGAFFDQLLDTLQRDYCIDSARVFATGHSIGAYFTNYLGCTRGQRLRAIAPIAGGGPLDTSHCVGQPAVLIGHNPAECAEATSPECPFAVPWADTGWPSLQFWATHNGCDAPAPMPLEPYHDTPPCRPLTGCDPRSPVTLCLYDYETLFAGPHAWPTPWMARTLVTAFLQLPGG